MNIYTLRHAFLLSTALLTLPATASEADSGAPQEPEKSKIHVAPMGRVLLDGALYASPQKDLFPEGATISDVRLGVKMNYEKWSAVINIGYAYNKVGIVDSYMRYDFNEKNNLRAGCFIHQYGLQSSTSSSMKVTSEEPIANVIFTDSRLIGVMYTHSQEKFYAAASAFVEPDALDVFLAPNQFTREGYGLRTRLVARPVVRDGLILQAGISGGFSTPQRNYKEVDGDEAIDLHNAFRFKANFPTRVARVTAVDETVDEAHNLWKFSPELLLSYGPVALESQYYFQQVNRRDLPAYQAQGAYAIVRGLFTGAHYGYQPGTAELATPGKGSLEGVLSYNYVNLSDRSAGILGGRIDDFGFTLNYYINKYFIARLHYSYTHTRDRGTFAPMTLNGFMARLQVLF